MFVWSKRQHLSAGAMICSLCLHIEHLFENLILLLDSGDKLLTLANKLKCGAKTSRRQDGCGSTVS